MVCNAFEWHTMEYLTSHLYFLTIHTSVHTKKTQVTSGIFHFIPRVTILYHAIENTVASKAFIINARKSQCMMGRLEVIPLNCNDRWEGFVEYVPIYHGFPAF